MYRIAHDSVHLEENDQFAGSNKTQLIVDKVEIIIFFICSRDSRLKSSKK